MRISRQSWQVWGCVWIGCQLMAYSVIAADRAPDFETEIAPILAKRCLECHNARDAAGKLVLTTASGAQAGGEGGPVLVPGHPDQSSLLERIVSSEMPPPRRGKPQTLPGDEQQLLRAWIAAGASWPADRTLDLFEATSDVRAGRDWWSLQPLAKSEPPATPSTNVVDVFVQERLATAGMEPAPEAERSILIRRLYDDLIGLPPTFEEIQAFQADHTPQAYENVVDRLLASPHFGERQARYWLDLVRYAETCGYERDQEKPFAWKYRDWVVKAFNDDKPFNRFVLEQLAGDELPDRSVETVTATGFLMLGTWNDEPNDPQEYKYERLEDLVHATSSAFLGMTIKCARCHDHKFDPISQEDYYRVAGVFWPGAIEPRGRELIGGPSKDELGFADLLGWTDIRRDVPALHLLKKGDPRFPLDVVEPAHLSMMPAMNRPWRSSPENAATSQRRLQLAEWIVDPANPLTPRVIVNRLWQHHFGDGLVRSPNDFGFNGMKPTHPELLDWLAADLVEHGWTLKWLHKLMVMSRTYRQSSLHPKQEDYLQRDAGNTFWWHAERHRRDAESLRDAMLAASGELDLRIGGPSFKPSIDAEALEGLSMKSGAWKESPPAEQLRRSLYMFSQRNLLSPMMTTFDFPDTTLPCGQRDDTTVAPQALALLNGRFVQERSAALSRRIRAAASNDDEVISTAWRFAVGRDPSPEEAARASNYLIEQLRYFENQNPAVPPTAAPQELLIQNGLTLHLRADRGIELDNSGRVQAWRDFSPTGHHAAQEVAIKRPVLVNDAHTGRPALQFDGDRRSLNLAGQVISSPEAMIFAVISDRGPAGHREIFSNWNGAAGNSTTSLFLGLTSESSVRLSDTFAPAGQIADRKRLFLLTAAIGNQEAVISQNGRELARKSGGLGPRNLSGNYVLGTQGNIDGEYWHGDIAELVVFDRLLSESERDLVTAYLLARYGLAKSEEQPDPAQLALASLCQVLLNMNEFLYVD
ncbi:MAG: PSD1 and planctomycete cytochrome C domain-containing protein [Planctomycetaceae bacterium]